MLSSTKGMDTDQLFIFLFPALINLQKVVVSTENASFSQQRKGQGDALVSFVLVQ